ncbi:hypothetical protein ACFXJO_33275 [Streptomyces lavendulae]|uniref:hypothetical protein n=1 Tax=Streptomyces lavendulae TaxID=1914 RepID=UPI0036749CE1
MWLLDGERQHLVGDGSSLDEDITNGPASPKPRAEAFETVQARATPYAEFEI